MSKQKTNQKAEKELGSNLPAKKEVKKIDIFSEGLNNKLKNSDLENVFDSGIFENTQEAVSVTSKVFGKDFWKEREGMEIQVVYTGLGTMKSEYHEGKEIDVAEVVLRDDSKSAPVPGICPQAVLVSSFKRSGPGCYLVTYKGIGEGNKFDYMDFDVKLLTNFKKLNPNG